MAKSTVTGTASGSASADLSTLQKIAQKPPAVQKSVQQDPDLPAPGQPYSRTKPVQKDPDKTSTLSDITKGFQSVRELTKSGRSPSKGGR